MKQGFWADFFSSDNFAGRPYGFTTNQIGHSVVIGFLGLVYGITLIYFLAFGEFPYKWQIAAFAGVMYASFEVLVQGWKGWDTIEDWWFVNVYGVWGPLCSFSEKQVGSPEVLSNLYSPVPFIALFVAHLFAGAYVRWSRLT